MAQGFPGAIASDRGSSRGNISGDSGPNRKAKGRFVLKLRTLLSLSLVLTPLWGLAPVADAMAQEELQQGPNTLVIHYRAARTDRTAFRAYLEKDFAARSEEHTSELQSLMRSSYAVFCLKIKNPNNTSKLYAQKSKDQNYFLLNK